jgi:hypothetical protein
MWLMDASLRIVRIVRIAMLLSIVMYGFVGEYARPPMNSPNPIIFYALTFVSISMAALIIWMRRLLISPAEAVLAANASETTALNRWRAGYMVIYAICEAIALYGLVLRFLGFTLSQVAPFYAAGFILLVFLSPRPPSNELS